MDTFRVRLNCIDHYQSQPTELDPPLFGPNGSTQARNAPQVPIIRVFGSTETGQKVCAHIHGAFPYLFIEYRGSLDNDEVTKYIQQLRVSIDHALAVSYRRNIYDGKSTFVAHISLVKGVPFFGYHVGYRYFLKIYLLNPLNMNRFSDLLYQGAIMSTVLQPFEAHAQYLQQWMCDYNLYGCSYMHCEKVRFRDPVPSSEGVTSSQHKWHEGTIDPSQISNLDQFPRLSHCSLEIDIVVQDILNRHEVRPRDQHHDFMERLQLKDPVDKFVHSLSGLWRDETRRRRLRMGLKDPSSSPFPPEVLVSMSADARVTGEHGWIHEAEYRATINQLIEEERAKGEPTATPSFEDFVPANSLSDTVKTATESVEDLYPRNLFRDRSFTLNDGSSEELSQEFSDVQKPIVDESSIPSFEAEEFPYESDEEVARQMALSQNGKRSAPSSANSTPRKSRFLPATTPSKKGSQASKPVNIQGTQSQGSPDEVTLREAWRRERYSGQSHEPHTGSPVTREPRSVTGGFLLAKNAIVSHRSSSERDTDAVLSPSRHKRQKVAHCPTSNTDELLLNVEEDTERPQSRHVKFEEVAKDGDPPNGSQTKLNGSETPSSSQLSQSSVKASGDNTGQVKGFLVSKPLSSSQEFRHSSENKGLKDSSSSTVSEKHLQSNGTSQAQTSDTNSTISDQYGSVGTTQLSQATVTAFGKSFPKTKSSKSFLYTTAAPKRDQLVYWRADPPLPSVVYRDAYYSNETDVPDKARDYAGREFRLESTTLPYLPAFDPTALSAPSFGEKEVVSVDADKMNAKAAQRQRFCSLRNWEIEKNPPSRAEVVQWVRENPRDVQKPKIRKGGKVSRRTPRKPAANPLLSQIEGPTQKHKHGSKFGRKEQSTSVRHETQYMSTMSLEIHVNSRENLAPNPEQDEVACIFWCLKSDEEEHHSSGTSGLLPGSRVGVIVLSDREQMADCVAKELGVEIQHESDELDLLNKLIDTVREFDPDVITGYEVHNSSWGYLIERARIKYELNLCDELSRMKSQSHGRFGKDADRWGFQTTSSVRVTGRHTINIWRAMRSEVNLLQYTMENLVFHLLQKRVPHHSFKDLTTWYRSSKARDLAKTLQYFVSRVQLDLEILDANELIPRTSEQARLIGVDFFSVFSRGSQFKVESFMFRIAKPENFILVSPSKKQVGQQNALECLPLVMEPQSAFYTSPLLVLDFQSLYPSIMIAYNYCYSTCLGRVVGWRGQNKMGFADFKRQPRLLELVKDYINIAPNGMMYVKPEMRKSLLAKMLSEILETRVMVKSGMKVDKDDATLQQLLNNRQLALKLLANVTYGYTSASFSGRMPCAEIADSIVQTARETLERAIALIHSVKEWGAEVVYGDTDSLFVYLKGRTKDEAFDLGQEIARRVTEANPRPIKLKFEKVYFPCVLLAKKRYVGFKYESKNQTEPEFDAKGIETVRRDGTPAEQKIEETALKLLFRTSDLSQVKSYFQRQCMKIMQGRVSIQDFCFAREVKLGHYSDKGLPPPGALISTRKMLEDPRTEPQYGERVPYVVATGAPGARLIDRCIAPEQLLKEEGQLDAEYYILKNLIPPLERIFNLVGADVRKWYDEMTKIHHIRDVSMQVAPEVGALVPLKRTMESYMKSSHCLVCRTKLPPQRSLQSDGVLPFCEECRDDASSTLFKLRTRLRAAQKKAAQLEGICRSCSGFAWAEEVKCDSKDCPVYYSRVKARTTEQKMTVLVNGVGKALEDLEW